MSVEKPTTVQNLCSCVAVVERILWNSSYVLSLEKNDKARRVVKDDEQTRAKTAEKLAGIVVLSTLNTSSQLVYGTTELFRQPHAKMPLAPIKLTK